ncbi:GTPase ObgE [Desulfovibrio inopinatus]|uniref:GTPase ObgE n=1 Tax=Desulfovibrio inopinatus TaxID=102109 RepID=UPI0003F938D5|nr:GTPase ObgE [Desulfovibrio inopinatus]
MRFIDEANIMVVSGKGGHGCVSFRREKFIPKGGPDGGDGGKGGDVIFRTVDNLLTLYDLRLKRRYEAKNGGYGMGRQRTGAKAADLVVDVPVGTLFYEIGEEGESHLAADLKELGQTFVAARGGRGGKGNTHFKSSTMRAPRFAQPGEEGEEKRFRLELKILADVGLLGLPNAGKSTFISAVSMAKPKIASYPFTTITPNLGVVEGDRGDRFVIADIPGLVEGAHEGVGLGHRFLRHVERTRVLLHILSAEDVSEEAPWAGFDLINAELAAYNPELAKKKQIPVINKIDLLEPEALEAMRQRAREDGREILFMSAKYGDGVEDVVKTLWEAVIHGREEDKPHVDDTVEHEESSDV